MYMNGYLGVFKMIRLFSSMLIILCICSSVFADSTYCQTSCSSDGSGGQLCNTYCN